MDGVFLSLDHTAFLSLSDVKVNDDGSTSGLFRKEIIKIGHYYKESDNLRFEITRSVLDNWIAQFRIMQENGVKVHVPLGHSDKSEDNRGWVKDLFVDGDALVMAVEMFDSDVANLVKRNDVSLFSPPEWTDGKGRRYIRPIRHIALTPVPLVPGLDEFRPLAASLGDDGMGMDLKKLGADLGIKDKLTEENAATLVLSHCASLKDASDKATKKVADLDKKISAMEKAVGDNKDKPVVGEMLLSMATKSRKAELTALVMAGKITPAVREKLEAVFVGEDSSAIRFSLETETTDVFDQVMAAIAENDPVKLGEQTSRQDNLKLSDPLKDEDANCLVLDAERRAKEEAVAV